ncbi:UDP-N-acetylmuramoyl-tripeptide--D-alanyl-D-alanine ligase [Legionella sp. km772]|uniref:UDP-N-acetylmuramoyl-tripeptide--D-alanyl-D- alanine ligase n=1 Tax=Legionella sp. km772 TaxID=2498111 RepID=UPI000F8C8CC4|nr:UDP-N-acetylmuramoyl-tripeptide--D-alanyl-D-alanine ligase [Legionella sp. km772]RUR13607.1 UDP-N-acetylmuramoyl-tripeptide--D-alanyl-D-alanine ligase [Legionella sp. km772]
MDLQNIAHILSLTSTDKTEVTGICTDSRQIKPGNVFIAIEGELFDGHAFVHEVEEKGAAAVIVKKRITDVSIPQFVVADPLMALAQIATEHRKHFPCPVIALTGSNGKTSVKEMISAILPKPSHATKGNLNNHIGAPLSVLALTAEHRYAVFELGANHPGEIAHTVAVVRPDVALINNIAPAHIEGFGSIDGVALAKGEIYQGLTAEGVAIVNDDDHYAHFWDETLLNKKIIRFSLEHPADVYTKEVRLDAQGRGQFTLVLPTGTIDLHLQVPGLHNVRNALAAAASCYALGISLEAIKNGLTQFGGVQGRMTILNGKNHSTIIDDTYNANLRSVLAGLEVLAKQPGNKIFVFGDMGELGNWAAEHHEEVGIVARRLGINQLLTCGSFSKLSSQAFGEGGLHFASQDEVVRFLDNKLDSNTTVLVKGSRSSAMEKIVQKLLN